MKLSLVVLASGSMQGKAIEIKLSQFLVGRDPQCHLRPASPLISKRHCAVIQRDGKVFIRDFGSTNGTSVNDEPVKGEAELHADDRLKIGPLLFSVKIEATAPVNQPTPLPPTKVPATTKTAPATPGTDANLPAAKKAAVAAAAKKPANAPAAAPAQAAKPAPAEEAPAPAAAAHAEAPAAVESETGEASGDDIAAMLLSLQDEDGPTTAGLSGDPVPDGSTVMDLVVPPGSDPNAPRGDKKEEKPNSNLGNTSNAAKSILEKYMRRPRNNG
jgi:predicted component of type VI protein secretion system